MKTLILLLFLATYSLYGNSGIFINEFMASNQSGIEDESGQKEDWVEIYNSNNFSVDLKGYHLTDDPGKQKKWTFPESTVIPPKSYLIVWFDGQPEEGPLHTPFKLSKAGEFVGLYAPGAVAVIDTITFGEQQEDISYGRESDGSPNWRFFNEPTPGESNSSTSVPAITWDSALIYPNPATDEIRLKLDHVIYEVRIIDISGKIFPIHYEISANEIIIDVSGLAPGNYQVLTYTLKNTFYHRFIKH